MSQFSALIQADGSFESSPIMLSHSDLNYWQNQLSQLPLVQVPADYSRLTRPSHRRRSHALAFTAPLRAVLAALAEQEQTTVALVGVAAFNVLLAYYSGQTDIVLGSAMEGAHGRQVLVLRTDLSGNPTFREILRRVTHGWQEASEHRGITLGLLRSVLPLHPDSRDHALFHAVFSISSGTSFASGESPEERACDLNVELVDDGHAWIGHIDYNANLYTKTTVRRCADYLERILTAVTEDSSLGIFDLLTLTASERRRLRTQQGTTVAVAENILPAEHVERWAHDQPERTAIIEHGRHMTYGELHRRATRLAQVLREQGVGPETRVGVCFDRSTDLIVALLAVFKAGGAYIPIDPKYPDDRIAFMIADSGMAMVVSDRQFAHLFAAFAGPVISGDDRLAMTDHCAAIDLTERCIASNLAYIIYTSGSTGRPKGVMVTHAGLANLMQWHARAFRINPDDRGTLVASPAFDASVWELWPYLTSGASVAIPDEETRTNPEALRNWIEESAVTVTFLPTPLAERLLALPWSSTALLRLMLTGGDTLHHYPAADLPFTLINNYGPTETTVVATAGRVINQQRNASSPSIGFFIENIEGYILNRTLQPVPVGIPGELYLGGKALARGYLGRPDITAERFIPDSFSGRAGDRLYRTGDIVRYRHNGNIEYIGRADSQVKIRGHRIELGEIKIVLSEHPSVKEVVVTVQGSSVDSRLVAYVVACEPATASSDELQRWVAERLPAYMVPAAIIMLEKLPFTPNGKLDQRALPAPVWSTGAVSPRNELEQRIADIWQTLLGIDHLSVHDHFFHIGGHSLLATQLLVRLREAFQVDLSFSILFEQPTIAGLAQVMAGVAPIQAEVVVGSIARPTTLPLSAAQQRLWFLEQLTPGTAVYNVPLAYQLDGHLDRVALQHSLDGLVARHEILRTTFAADDGPPRQVIHPPQSLPIIERDWRAHTDFSAALVTETVRPFDLANGLLLRVVLGVRSASSAVLLLIFHHSIIDGWSAGLFLRELSARYTVARAETALPLEAPAVQYADLAVWERNPYVQAAQARQVKYWVEHLAGIEPVDVPTDRLRPAVQTHRGALLPVRVPTAVSAGVGRLAYAAGVTPYMVLLAAYGALLGRYSGQGQVVVGTPIANRRRIEVEEMLGCVVNTLALQVDLRGMPSGWELLERVRQECLAGYAHQEAPVEQVVEALQLPRDLSRSPLFQHVFVLQDSVREQLDLAELTVETLIVHTQTSKFDLMLELQEGLTGYHGVLEYNTDLYSADTAAQLARHFLALLAALVEQPALPVHTLPLLSGAELNDLRVLGTAPTLPIPAVGLHQLVRTQLHRNPGAIALRAPQATWSAATLLQHVDILAAALATWPLGAEARIGVCLDRTPAMLVAVLAILQCGAAYVPLDPAYPADRLAFMCADAALSLVLTHDHLSNRLPASATPILSLDRLGVPANFSPTDKLALPTPPNVAVAPEQTAYLIYTSGSTGQPKAVAISHCSAVAFLQWATATFDLSSLAGVFAATSLSFDLSVFELFAPLCVGGAVILADTALQLPTHPHASHVTLLNTVPSVLSELLRLAPLPPTIRTVNLAGEPLPASLAVQVYAQPGVQALFNLYGPSEDTIYSTVACIARDGGPIVPIGRPISNTCAYVCDPHGALVPPGVWGELYLGGAGLARGYLERPDLTAEKFVPNPFNTGGDTRLYRTGDHVRWNRAGDLEYGGRLDQQVKLRGYRVELAEVTAALASYADVADAVALVQGHGASAQLVGYVVEAAGVALQGEEVRRRIAARLPGYMVPAAVVVLRAWPLTPNGKLDRRALPALNWGGDEPGRLRRGPGSPLETQVADIWAATLNSATVDVELNFFQAGGHSLLATQLVARLRTAFSVDLELRAIFEHPTIAELAAIIGQQQTQSPPAQPPAISRISRQGRRVQISSQGVLTPSQD